MLSFLKGGPLCLYFLGLSFMAHNTPIMASAGQSQALFNVIQKHTLKQDIDAMFAEFPHDNTPFQGEESLLKKIQKLIDAQKPLIFTICGFPFKSTYAKGHVIAQNPDMAEREALLNLQSFVDQLSSHYQGEVKVIIYTDGIALAPLLNIAIQDVQTYENNLKKLAADLKGIEINTPFDLFPKATAKEIESMIDKKVKKTPPLDEKGLELWLNHLSKELGYKASSKLNYDLSLRGAAFSKILKEYLPKDSLKLSVHFSKDLSQKIGFQFLKGVLTPWHGVAVKHKDGHFEVVPKKETQNLALKNKNINTVTCYYYE